MRKKREVRRGAKQPRYDAVSDEFGQRIAHRLLEFRMAANLSSEEIAEKSRISLSGIRKMEREDSNPAIRSLHQYVKACGRTLGEFFEPWLPEGSVQYDQHVHRTISAALRHHTARQHIYTFVQMLRELKVG